MGEKEFEDDESLDFASSTIVDDEIVDLDDIEQLEGSNEDVIVNSDEEVADVTQPNKNTSAPEEERDSDYDVTTAATEETHGSLSDAEVIENGLSSLSVPLNKIIGRNGSATDISSFVNEVFASVLGFDRFSEMSTHYNKHNDIVDTSIMIDDRIKVLVKSASIESNFDELGLDLTEEVRSQSVRWLILTTGKKWIIYRDLNGDIPLFVAEFDFFDQAEAVNYLKFFTKEMFIKNGSDAILDKYRETFMDIAREAIMSDQALQIIKEALAAKNMHIGTSVVRTVAKGILKEDNE